MRLVGTVDRSRYSSDFRETVSITNNNQLMVLNVNRILCN